MAVTSSKQGLTIRRRKRLPHWEAPQAIYFVTFRLFDSIPQDTLRMFVTERRGLIASASQRNPSLTAREQRRLGRLFTRKIEGYLDQGVGSCVLALPRVAEAVAGALRYFDGIRYKLYAWCVMPNHVHVIFEPSPDHSLAQIVHTWKSFTAQRANRILGRGGEFWQREYYDHLIRNGRQLDRLVQYVLENPKRAGLNNWRWVEVR